MEQSNSLGREPVTLQTWGSKLHEESQLPVYPDPANMSVLSYRAGATENGDVIGEAQTENRFDAHIDKIQVAQAAIGYRPQNQQLSNMESIKALLRNFLDDITGPPTESSFYFDGLLSQWLDIWRRDRTHALLIYVLGDGSEQYKDRNLEVDELETIDKIKTKVLEQQCIQQGACLHLAKMTSAVNTDADETLELKMAISLHEIRDLSGGLLVNKPVAVCRESIIQKCLLKERYDRAISPPNPYPSPTEGSPAHQTDTAKSFQDWVSPS